MLHLVPGFFNLKVINNVQLTPGAIPFSMYLNLDKGFVGIFLIGLTNSIALYHGQWYLLFKQAALYIILSLILMMGFALLLGFVTWEPKLPSFTPLWIITNLLLVCTPETVFFQSFLQKKLIQHFKKFPGKVPFGIGMAAICFVLMHKGAIFNPQFALLTFIAGIVYGWIYQRTARLEVSIMAHFVINLIHYLFFSYPGLLVAN